MSSTAAKAKIHIIYYSTWGHIYRMAQEVAKGVESAGAEVKLFQVPETLPKEVLEKMHAPPKPDVPVATPQDLAEADGIIFGIPTRFGTMSAQMKAYFDSTGQLWQKGTLVGKPASIFFSTATQGGGQETTALTTVTQLTHHGMLFVPIGYGNPSLFNMDEVHGGSAYGAGTFAGGDGSRQPTQLELGVASYQGRYFAGVVTALKAGRAQVGQAGGASGQS